MIKQDYYHIDIYKPYQMFPGFSSEVGGDLLFCIYGSPV